MGTNAAVPSPYAAPQPVKSGSKKWIFIVLGILLLLLVLIGGCCAAVFLGVKKALKSSDVYAMSLQRAQASPCAVSKLGQPINGGSPDGSINKDNGGGDADITIPVDGSQGKGTLHTVASRENSIWTLTSVTLNVNGTNYDLPVTPGPCQ